MIPANAWRRAALRRRRLLSTGAALIPAALVAASPGAAAAATRAEGTEQPGNAAPAARMVPTALATSPQRWGTIAEAFGRPGNLIRGIYYHTAFPRWDLYVESKGVHVTPGLALASHASFAAYDDGQTLLMGDMVVPERALEGFLDDLSATGIMVTAVHKHLLAHSPQLWWVHACAVGSRPVDLALGLRSALTRAGTPPPAPVPAQGTLDLDCAGIDAALGARGAANGEVYTTVFVRREPIVDGGRLLPPGLGSTTAVNFQPVGAGRAAVNGDFAMTAQEVAPALAALRRGGLAVASLHNHGLTDEPRLFFTHFWAVDDAVRIAQALGDAVALTNVKPAAG